MPLNRKPLKQDSLGNKIARPATTTYIVSSQKIFFLVLFFDLENTSSVMKYKWYRFVLSQIMQSLTKFIEKSINIYNIKNININFLLYNFDQS